jgi:hypothetical protein
MSSDGSEMIKAAMGLPQTLIPGKSENSRDLGRRGNPISISKILHFTSRSKVEAGMQQSQTCFKVILHRSCLVIELPQV